MDGHEGTIGGVQCKVRKYRKGNCRFSELDVRDVRVVILQARYLCVAGRPRAVYGAGFMQRPSDIARMKIALPRSRLSAKMLRARVQMRYFPPQPDRRANR